MNNQELINGCYERESMAYHCCSLALIRGDLPSAIDANEAAYRAAINRFLLTSGRAGEKTLTDLEIISEEFAYLTQLNSGGTA